LKAQYSLLLRRMPLNPNQSISRNV